MFMVLQCDHLQNSILDNSVYGTTEARSYVFTIPAIGAPSRTSLDLAELTVP